MIRIRSRSPLVSLALRQSKGLRQLCPLWFEYDLCWNRKPPSDHRICLMTLIRIRSTSDLKGLSCDSNMIKKPPSIWQICRSSGYRQLCSLWFEYDLCLKRKPPNDLERFLTTLIQIRSKSDPKGVKLWFRYDQEAPKWVWPWADQKGYGIYVLFGSNTTYVWTGSPQVTIRFTARFRSIMSWTKKVKLDSNMIRPLIVMCEK